MSQKYIDMDIIHRYDGYLIDFNSNKVLQNVDRHIVIYSPMIGYKNMIEIKDIPDYYIDFEGTIYSKLSNKIMKPFINGNIKKIRIKKSKVYQIAHLVAKQFLPKTEKQTILRYLDGNPQNTHITNLQWNIDTGLDIDQLYERKPLIVKNNNNGTPVRILT